MHILVTGGSRGIGAAVCRLAGSRGWRVSLSYQTDAEAAARVVAAVEAAGGRAMAIEANAADERDT
ncbi:MAG: SDR family NAD(P)-dependent oxidoreductase, partial [Rhodobacteraceae bacterium]|nr:SDR family NAD(P)-dependent oxidoreductase [Paracoccaceae bacterium]